MIPAPIILYPMTNWSALGDQTYYSDALIQTVSGYVPVVSGEIVTGTIIIVKYQYKIDRNGVSGTWSSESTVNMTVGTSNTSVTSVPWSFFSEDVFELYAGDVLTMSFKAYKVSNVYSHIGEVIDYSDSSTIIANIVEESEITASARPVTGILIRRYIDHIKIMVPTSGIVINDDNDFSGCNFYMSLTPGSGYVLMNDIPVVDVDAQETVETLTTESSFEDTVNDITITTTRSKQVTTQYYTYTLNKTVIAKLVQQGKIVNIFLADGQTLSSDNIYYMLATVTTFDTALNQSVESPYSEELEGQFLTYSTDYQNLPKRSRSDVLYSLSKELMVNNDLINVVPGSVIRDISDPIALEFEKLYVIQDFIFSCLSLDTLIAFDDADGDGVSDAVSLSLPKKTLASALGLKDYTNVQLLIDEQFEKYASNYNMERKGATKSSGTVIFYTDLAPTSDILIPDGMIISTSADYAASLGVINFVVKGSKILSSANAEAYYNTSTRYYEIESNIEAQRAGSSGNVPAGVVTVAVNVSPGVRVTNRIPTRYGSDRENNQLLTDRIKTARLEYDSGTEGGYNSVALDVPGVIQTRTEIAGDDLMMRDYDSATGNHVGGKVDVYIRGEQILQLTDQVAFNYEYPTDTYGNKTGESFYVSDASDYRLRCKNPKVDTDNPIVSVSEVRNTTRGRSYSLDNLQIIGESDTILLEKNQTNLDIGLATFDVVEVTYLYRSSNILVLSQQPVLSIVSVSTSNEDLIDPSKYSLIKLEDPLLNGNSSIAQDSVKFLFDESDNIQEYVTVTDEQHDMLYDTPAMLTLKGVDINTIVVKSEDDSSTYILDVDYSVTAGSNTTYTYLNLMYYGQIRSGDRVNVSYNASVNFNVVYTTNNLIPQVQEKIDEMKHACADVIVKQSIKNFVDLGFVVVKKTGTDSSLLKSRIITAISNYTSELKSGDTLTQSAVASVVRGLSGVKDIRIPFTKMMKRNGSFISMDEIGYTNFELFNKAISSGVISYRSLESVLSYRTTDNGGDSNLFRGVYEDNKILTLVSDPLDVSEEKGCAYIQADGKIIVSTTDNKPPQSKYYKASYFTYYSASQVEASDIDTSTIEYLDIDSISMRDIEFVEEKVVKRGY